MIDIHNHMLPAVDDGAESMDMSLEMLRRGQAEGIEAAVLTPHILPEDSSEKDALHRRRFTELEEAVYNAGLKMRLYLGAEIRFRLDMASVAQWMSPTIGDTNYALLDLPFGSGPLPLGLETCLFELRTAGYRPILAHPERHPRLIGDMNQLSRLRQQEVTLQLNGGSLLGHFGRRAKQGAEMLLERGWVECIASDGHNLSKRPFTLRQVRDNVSQEFGAVEAARLLVENPTRVIQGEAVVRRQTRKANPRQGLFKRLLSAWS
jgi:protein-tyrosine phosphatase